MAGPEADDGAVLATAGALHDFLTLECGLVPEPAHGGTWRNYFDGVVERHPARSTRIANMLLDHAGRPFRLQMCVSSDSNNTVMLQPPFARDAVRGAVEAERRARRPSPGIE